MTGPSSVSIASEMQALIDAMVTAYRAGDAAGCAALFTADAVLHAPGAPPARGCAAIAACAEGLPNVGPCRIALRLGAEPAPATLALAGRIAESRGAAVAARGAA